MFDWLNVDLIYGIIFDVTIMRNLEIKKNSSLKLREILDQHCIHQSGGHEVCIHQSWGHEKFVYISQGVMKLAISNRIVIYTTRNIFCVFQ